MAAVVQTGLPARHVLGDLVLRVFNLSGATGSTLQTGQGQILWIGVQPGSLITAAVASAGTITFTSSAPMTAETVLVLSRTG